MRALTYGTSMVAATLLALSTSTAGAVTFSVTEFSSTLGGDGYAMNLGEEFTLGIRVSADADVLSGLGASIFGYDDSIVEFVSGEAVDSIFHQVAIPNVGAFNGLTNLASGTLAESSIGSFGPRVQIFNGVSLSSYSAQPLDPGLDGEVGADDAQFRVTFRMIGLGVTTLQIGTGYEGDAVVLPGGTTIQAAGATVAVGIIPEPGTALLMGLGLAGLAARRSTVPPR
ncbi:MAG: PEP-CTERM sorting domain-containing protein [Myxococcota bacterium]